MSDERTHGDLVAGMALVVKDLDIDAAGEMIAGLIDIAPSAAAEILGRYCGEAVATIRLVEPRLSGRTRLLEVGSGLGLAANFLASRGFEVVELEPVGLGFGYFAAARDVLSAMMDRPATHLALGVDDLDPACHGKFDLAYSLNVLEHLPDWRRALGCIMSVLGANGVCLQSCPNYAVPYEPHFGLPLIPFAPARTSHVVSRRISESEVWHSLNWVTSGQVRRWARDQSVDLTFVPGQLSDALLRLSSDPVFRERHGGWMASAAKVLDRTGVLALTRRMPPGLNTPMQFELRLR